MKDRLIEYARSGGTLIGVSAGAIIMSPNIESSALCGDTNLIGLSEMSGLSLFPFPFWWFPTPKTLKTWFERPKRS